jgi:hypothetical protein
MFNQRSQKLFSRLYQNNGRASIWILVLAGAITWGPTAVLGQTIISDPGYPTAHWSVMPLVPSSTNPSSCSAKPVTLGNEPNAPSQVTVDTYGAPGAISCAHVYTAAAGVINPNLGVASLSYAYALAQITPFPVGHEVAYRPLVVQKFGTGDAYYAGPTDAIGGQLYWPPLTHPNLVSAQFTLISGPPGAPPNPNFSCTGTNFQVGYLTANSDSSGNGQTATYSSAIDNWSVTVNRPAPLQPMFSLTMNDIPTISATTTNPPSGTSYGWYVTEVNAAGAPIGTSWNDPPSWWTEQTSFPGYTFALGHHYRITLGWWNSCANSWAQWTTIASP